MVWQLKNQTWRKLTAADRPLAILEHLNGA